MKRTGNIYAKITTEENLRKAALSASLGKRDKFFVKKILENQDKYIERVQKILLSKEGILSPYSVKEIQDGSSGKIRNIYKPKFFPDQIIHWALMLQIEPLIMRGMYQYSCGSVPGRGILYGKKALESWIKKDKERTRYYLKMDIKKFYPSINNELLKQAFRRIIKDEECLWLIDLIIDSAEGLPIGNYTSQWFLISSFRTSIISLRKNFILITIFAMSMTWFFYQTIKPSFTRLKIELLNSWR
jgi:RNA-directed DNA polymerase